MLIADVASFCTDTAPVWQFVGYVLYVFKIVIPILLIIFGMLDLGKAVVASDDKEIKNATTKLAKRAVAAVVIFFIPLLIGVILNLVSGFAEVKDAYKACEQCVVRPTKDACKGYVSKANS